MTTQCCKCKKDTTNNSCNHGTDWCCDCYEDPSDEDYEVD
jgi:hypothetical protein